MLNTRCPCNSGLPFAECCEPILADIRLAHTPGQVVQARFTAMAAGDMDFFRKSIVRRFRNRFREDDIRAVSRRLRFRAIRITREEIIGVLRRQAIVQSRVTCGKGSKLSTHAERTYLQRETGAWRVTHVDLVTATPPPAGRSRNAPCACGSGRKYKRCCGSTDQIEVVSLGG